MGLRVLYIDEIFLINLVADYFILLAAAKLCSVYVTRRRLAIAAAFGAVYAVLAALPPLKFLTYPAAIMITFALTVAIAFDVPHRLTRVLAVTFGVAATMAGVISALSNLSPGGVAQIDLRLLAITFAAGYVGLTLVFRRVARRGVIDGTDGGLCEVRISTSSLDKTIRNVLVRALADNGNSLTDPVSGARVCIVAVDDAIALFAPPERERLRAAVKSADYSALAEVTTAKLRLLPYSAVGVTGGSLICFRPERITCNGHARQDLIVALSPNSVSDNGLYNALI